jgi:FkbM family methyltransferase
VYSHAEVLMVEPQRRHRQSLIDFCAANGPGLRTEHTLLGPPGQTSAVFHVTEDASGGTGSSVLPENSDVPRRAETMPMTTLDDLLQRTGIPAPDLLKLDVQGFEIEVLKGAQATLAASPLVLLEVSFWPYNIGAPLLHDVLQWMQRSGYRAYDVLDLSRRPDETLVQADILFASANSPLLTEQTTRFFSRA